MASILSIYRDVAHYLRTRLPTDQRDGYSVKPMNCLSPRQHLLVYEGKFHENN